MHIDKELRKRVTFSGLVEKLKEKDQPHKIKRYKLDGEQEKWVCWKTKAHECYAYFDKEGSLVQYDAEVAGPRGYHLVGDPGDQYEEREFKRALGHLGIDFVEKPLSRTYVSDHVIEFRDF